MCFQSRTLLRPWYTLLKISKRWTAAVTVSLVFQWKIVVSVACMSRLPDKMSWIGSTNAQSSLYCTTWGCTPEYCIHGLYCQNSCWNVDAVGMAHVLVLVFRSVRTEVHVSRKRPCFKKCIFRETAWAVFRTSIAGIRVSTDLKSFYGLRQNRGKHS